MLFSNATVICIGGLSMALVLLFSQDKIAFASVHDSYWTHACDVDEMSVVLRDTFIELHSQDILGKLRQEVISFPERDLHQVSSNIDLWPSSFHQFITRYNGHVVPVAKIPAGLRSVEPGDPIPAAPSPTDPHADATNSDVDEPAVSAVISELEAEDGGDSLSIFAQSKQVKRASALKTPWDDVDPEDEDGGSAAVWKSTSKKTDSKLVYLADVLPPAPGKGDFDLNLVRSSPYLCVISRSRLLMMLPRPWC